MEILDRCPMAKVDGFPYPAYAFRERNFRQIFAMVPRSGDIFINTYPKCGTTWTQYIVWGILHDGASAPGLHEMLGRVIPFLELVGLDNIDNMPAPRVMKLHLPIRLTPKSDQAKYIIVARNPYDACVSFFHHLNEIDYKALNINVRFDPFFDDYLEGNVPFGDYFEHVVEWYDRRNDPNVLFLFFEDMKADHRGHVMKIAEFLGDEYRDKLIEHPEILDLIVEHSTFDYMKKNVELKITKNPAVEEETRKTHGILTFYPDAEYQVNFFREGAVGGSKTSLTDEQRKRIDKAIDERVKDPALMQKLKIFCT